MKSYNVKIYALNGTTLVRIISPDIIMWGFSWTEQVNGWQGQLKLKIKLPFSSSNLAYNQIVRVYSSDPDYSASPRLIYSWIVSILKRVSDMNWEYIEMTAIGLASMLSWLYYTTGWTTYTFNKNQAQHLTMKDIIDVFTVKYPALITYNWTSVENSVASWNLAFDYDKMIDAIKTTTETTTYWWSVDRNGLLQFHPKAWWATPTTHYLTISKDIEQLEVEENSEKIVNKYMVKYNWGWPYIASDATSQTNNGLRELYEDKSTDLNDLTVATSAGDAYISANKDVKKRIVVTVNSEYDIDSIQAGHFVTIRNLDYTISFLQIVRLEYNMDKVRLELQQTRSFADEILS